MTEEQPKVTPEEQKSQEEWTDIGRRIEAQIKRDLASFAGAQETDGWAVIGQKIETRIRVGMAMGLGQGIGLRSAEEPPDGARGRVESLAYEVDLPPGCEVAQAAIEAIPSWNQPPGVQTSSPLRFFCAPRSM